MSARIELRRRGMATTALAVMSGLAALGCESVPEPPPGRVAAASETGDAGGYVHRFSASRFALGGSAVEKIEFGVDKHIGPWGVFGRNVDTDMALALPNADAPTRDKPPLAGGAAAQTSAVRAYFVAAGLPVGQILDVKPMAEMSASGAGTTEPEPAAATLDRYYGMIHREVAGVPVADSYAWASIDEDSEVVAESVYWPSIPRSVVAEAKGFKAKLADSSWRAAFLAKLPGPGKLVIHHTPGEWTGQFAASVGYDVQSPGGMMGYHFDENAIAFLLPSEEPSPTPAPATPKP